ncbi:polysaccharide deacetylase family protein [Sporomusa ovata]|nr:polysaccharide deacetylase family protein [Sporomusa ovata]
MNQVVTLILFFILGLSYIALTYFQGIPVLNYHQINNENHNVLTLSDTEFEAQIKYLYQEGYTAISPEQLADYLQYGKELPNKPILITFDDGYEDNYQVAYPILQKYHFKATIFLITDFAGKYSRYLTWQQIREMSDNGINFESHTLSHIILPKASDEEVYAQLVNSKKALEWRLGKKVEYLAYPGGKCDQRIIQLAKEAGYRAAFTVNFGRNRTNSTMYTLNRIPIFGGGTHTFFHFWLRLKFTPVFNALQEFKIFLLNQGNTFLAGLIYIP